MGGNSTAGLMVDGLIVFFYFALIMSCCCHECILFNRALVGNGGNAWNT